LEQVQNEQGLIDHKNSNTTPTVSQRFEKYS
jgi:hypothetical protein